jgi:hypothetical protein
MAQTGKRFIDTKIAAKLLGKAPATLANERHRHCGLPYLKIRGRVLYDLHDVKAYLDNCKVFPQSR